MANDVLAQELSAAYHEGNILLESAADDVFALTRMLVEPVPTIAPWTVRSAAKDSRPEYDSRKRHREPVDEVVIEPHVIPRAARPERGMWITVLDSIGSAVQDA